MELKRVVVTGLGALTPIGNNLNDYWNNLKMGVSGAAPITHFDTSQFKTKFACELKNFDINDHLDRKEIKRLDPFSQFAMAAAHEAMTDAGLVDNNEVNKDRFGVIWSSGIGGIQIFQQEISEFFTGTGTPRFNPFFIPKMIIDIAPGHISMRYGLRGPNFSVVSACASSTNSMID
ncbi:MAG: beta-ketoacyl-[acyl-carrier-protein] synthase II, partial [Bacteroidetes bacterium]|nr:beta-ketoacyl-[acyl-carrier-protein] synthase II [Bacteroidota bacterium]